VKDSVTSVPLSGSVGVETKGAGLSVVLRASSLRLFIRGEIAQHGGVLMRGQEIEPDQVNAFMSGFGPLYGSVMGRNEKGDPSRASHIPGNPHIKVMPMAQDDGVPAATATRRRR
jgi:hypothetical protein